MKNSKEAKLTVITKKKDMENNTQNNYNNSNSISNSSTVFLYPQPSYNYALLNGTNLRLACAASGYPIPTTIWTFFPYEAGTTTKITCIAFQP